MKQARHDTMQNAWARSDTRVARASHLTMASCLLRWGMGLQTYLMLWTNAFNVQHLCELVEAAMKVVAKLHEVFDVKNVGKVDLRAKTASNLDRKAGPSTLGFDGGHSHHCVCRFIIMQRNYLLGVCAALYTTCQLLMVASETLMPNA